MFKMMVMEIVVRIDIAILPSSSLLLPTFSTRYPKNGGMKRLTILHSKVACLLIINPKPLN